MFGSVHCVVALAFVAVLTSCGGSSEPQTFSAADAKWVASVRPTTPGWTWPRNPISPDPSTRDDLDVNSTDPLQEALDRELVDAGAIEGAVGGSKWRDDTKLANLAAGVFESATGAHAAMAAIRVFARGWGERSGDVIRDEEIDGLGDEAWRLWVGGNGVQVTYEWRRGNLVLEAHIHCFDVCPPDVDSLTRVWVDAIDEEARTER